MTTSTNADQIAYWENAIADMMVCYVLCRTDTPGLPSVGRLGAQLHHNGMQMAAEMQAKNFPDLNAMYDEWLADPVAELAAAQNPDDAELVQKAADAKRSFGTAITLAVSAAEMRQAVSLAQLIGLHAGITFDPTYPVFLKDGDCNKVAVLPVESCAYVFGRKSQCTPIVQNFPLLREAHFA